MNISIPRLNIKRFSKFFSKRSGTANPAQWLIDWVTGGQMVSSGVKVNQQTALQYTPFWASVRIISGTIGALPFNVYKRVESGKELDSSHRVFNLIHNRPNEFMDALTFIETRQAHALTYGNGYAEIQRDGAGRPVALWPLLPNRTVRKVSANGIPFYEVTPKTGDVVQLPDINVLHIKGLGFDGLTGYNVVEFHKEAIGYGIAAKRYGSTFFGNNATPDGILTHPEALSVQAADRLSKSWNQKNQGLSNSHRTQILEEGMTWKQTSIDPEKAQALDTQKYNVDDCSRIFNIPPHKLGSMDRATFSNIEEQNINFVSQTMFYWFRKWEQECNYKLFSPSERSTLFCELLVDGLLRGDIKSRTKAYAGGRQWGYLSINDIRRKENMNTIGKEGDIYLDPLNMKPAGTETPQNNNTNNMGSNSIRNAHYDLIESQWRIIIRKQIGAKQKPNYSYLRSQQDAGVVLFKCVMAYASVCQNDVRTAGDAMSDVVSNNLCENVTLTESDAGRLTHEIMSRIGGYHARS